MTTKNISITVLLAILVVLAVYFFIWPGRTGGPVLAPSAVASFEDCVAAGNPVMESYPRQCSHEGVTYTENLPSAPAGNPTPTSADNAPPGSLHNLPVPAAVAAARAFAASGLGVAEGEVVILSAYEKEWSDSCLGLGGAAEICAAVMTPGYEVTLQAKGKQYIYRTNADGSVIRPAQ